MTLVELARFFWLPELARIKGNMEHGLQDWILAGDYLVSTTPTNKKIELFPRSTDSFVKAIAYDFSCLSSAAFESAESVNEHPKLPYSSGWVLIQSYYAAYYAANALMRCFGYSCTNLDIAQISTLKDTARLCGYPCSTLKKANPDSGAYFIEYSMSDSEINLFVINSKGGVHGKFWESFSKFLNRLESKIESSVVLLREDKKSAKKELEIIAKMLSASGSTTPNWLSLVRNNINYRLGYDVWHPYKDCELNTVEILNLFENSWKQPPNVDSVKVSNDNLQKFITANGFLISWCRATLVKMWETNSSNTHFLKKGPLAFLEEANG